jgi:hypothetical protein
MLNSAEFGVCRKVERYTAKILAHPIDKRTSPINRTRNLTAQNMYSGFTGPWVGLELVIGIHQMLNVIIRSVHFYFFCFTDDIYMGRASRQQ